jgi:hypothetical protein
MGRGGSNPPSDTPATGRNSRSPRKPIVVLRRERRVTTVLEQGAAPRSAASVRRPVSSSAVKVADAASGASGPLSRGLPTYRKC